MRIVIDLQAVQSESRFRGIGRYSLSLARAMAREATHRGDEVYVVLNGKFPQTVVTIREDLFGLLPQDHIVVFSTPEHTNGNSDAPGHLWRARAADLVREAFLAALRPDVVHVSGLFDGWGDETNVGVNSGLHELPTAVTLYDLIPYVMSDIYLADGGYKTFYMQRIAALKRADYLLAISEHSKEEAIALLGFAPAQVTNISAAVGSQFKPACVDAATGQALLLNYEITRPFVLYVPGGFDPRKNLDRLIQAFAELPAPLRRGMQLVIGSKLPPGMGEPLLALAQAAGLEKGQLVFTGYLPDEHLITMYGLCRVSVFPSLHEGFGLPVLEAMACGAAVIASNTTSLPEVVGLPEALFDPESVADIARVMQRALEDQAFLDALHRHCAEHAGKFSWEEAANKALRCLRDAFPALGGNMTAAGDMQGDAAFDRIVAETTRVCGAAASEEDGQAVRESLRANQRAIARLTGTRQLLVDISELVARDAKSGIQRVVRSIVSQLLRNPPDGYRVELVYTPNGDGLRYANRFVAAFTGRPDAGLQDVPVTFGADDIFIGLDLIAHLFPAFSSTLRHMREAGVHIHYVVYDLTPLMDTRWHTVGMTQAFTHWIDGIVASAHSLICISEAVAKDVRSWFATQRPEWSNLPQISHFHLGADIANSVPTAGLPDNAAVVLNALKARPSFLMVGTLEPRKGYPQVLDAMDMLWQHVETAAAADINLVIVGKEGWNMQPLVDRIRSHPQFGRRLYWLEGISDEYLECVYERASALIAASEYEGFGLPLIEAAQHGLPIIARDIPVFREVAGEHAYWFAATDGAGLAQRLSEWLTQRTQGGVPQSKDMPWLTWEQSTDQLLKRVDEHARFHLGR
ncbi:MAG: glycosyltransferase family 4 protein [Janthinobacterium lividum]